jgi:hypothetical protein
MIDTPTAWSILCTPLGIAAGLGWIRCARMLKSQAVAWKHTCDRAFAGKMKAETALRESQEAASYYSSQWRRTQALASDLQERLDTEAAKRSSITSRGNLTRAAKRRAAKEARRLELEQNVADRAEPVRKAA